MQRDWAPRDLTCSRSAMWGSSPITPLRVRPQMRTSPCRASHALMAHLQHGVGGLQRHSSDAGVGKAGEGEAPGSQQVHSEAKIRLAVQTGQAVRLLASVWGEQCSVPSLVPLGQPLAGAWWTCQSLSSR